MDEERIPKMPPEWIPPERRKRGRPRRAWMDEVNEVISLRNLEIVDVWGTVKRGNWERRSVARRRNPEEEEEEV